MICACPIQTAQTLHNVKSNSVCVYAGVPYFFDYKMGVFSFQNSPKDLDPSCKMDLDLWDCLGRVKIGIIAKFHKTDLVI